MKNYEAINDFDKEALSLLEQAAKLAEDGKPESEFMPLIDKANALIKQSGTLAGDVIKQSRRNMLIPVVFQLIISLIIIGLVIYFVKIQ